LLEFHYQDYLAKAFYSARTKTYYGEVQNIPEVVVFQAKNRADLEQAFIQAIEAYIEVLAY